MLILSGQIPRDSIGKDIGLLHEVNDQLDCITPVTKWRKRVLQVADIPAAVREAAVQLRSGRPRPVELEMPPETMEDEGLAELLPPAEVPRPGAAARDVDRAAELLLGARAPLIYAGGGVHLSGAHDALAAVAEHLQAGVVHRGGQGGDERPQRALPRRRVLARLAAPRPHPGRRGARGGHAPGPGHLRAETRIVQIDADPQEIGRTHKQTLGLVGDARATLEALLEKLRAGAPPATVAQGRA